MARGRRSGRGLDYNWLGVCGLMNNVGTANVLGSNVITFSQAETLVRTRGEILVALDGPTDNDVKCVGIGIMIVTDAALAAGATAVPSPTDDLDAPWVWHQFVNLSAESATQTESLGTQVARYQIDSKAMRKVKASEAIIIVADGINGGGTPQADVSYGFRVLLGD